MKKGYILLAILIVLTLGILVFSIWPEKEPVQKIESPQASTLGVPNIPEADFFLTVPDLKRVDQLPVYSREVEQDLRESAYRVPNTGLPWQYGENTYVAGHRLGYPNTDSFLVFYDLTKLENGDKIYVEDHLGGKYTYEVYETITVGPNDMWVTEPVGEDIISLQTCTLPDYSDRIIVRAREI